jgi:polyferredoxin
LIALSGIVYGFNTLSPTEFKVIHDRQPLFVKLSDGSIQNKYTLKLLNKSKQEIQISYNIAGIEGASLHGLNNEITVQPGKVVPVTALVRVPAEQLETDILPIIFKGQVLSQPNLTVEYESMFMGPK